MKHTCLLLLSLITISLTFDAYSMFTPARARFIAAQRVRLSSRKNPLEKRVEHLEGIVNAQEDELAKIKEVVGRWSSNNYVDGKYCYAPFMEHTDSSFIEEHNMHYKNQLGD